MADYRDYTDETLRILFKKQDDGAFVEIYRRYWRILLDAAYKRISDRDLVQDIVQDVFVSLYTQRDRMQETGSLAAYLHVLLKHKVLDEVRRQLVRNNYRAEWQDSPAGADTTQSRLDEGELKALVDQAVARMPPKCREVYLLREEGQLSNQEIADRLGLSVKTVEGHITKALRILREALKDYPFNFIVLLVSALLNN